LWNTLHLHEGSIIAIDSDQLPLRTLKYIVLGHVDHLPTINDSTQGGLANESPPPGGVLVDYQTFYDIYQQDVATQGISLAPPSINQVWLHTVSDPRTRSALRASLSRDPLFFLPTTSQDRYQLLDLLHEDPFSVNLSGVLTLGVIVALLLAIVGDLLA